MLEVLKHPTYFRLFSAQVIALLGTGLLTIALALLAFDLAGDQAGMVLGTAYAIKMIAYVCLAPVASAVVDNLPRKAVLIGADVIRAVVALFLPFIESVWQIYVLIFVLQSASATFTPAFQAVIPDILVDEKDYTKALSLSRLAYDLEHLISPILAGLLLLVMSYHWLFGGTVVGFLCSTALVLIASIPAPNREGKTRPFLERLTRGSRIYLATPRLRGLLALNLSAAAAGAFVLVNTVVVVRSEYGRTATDVAYAMMAFGGGSMIAALSLPRLLETVSDRTLMVPAAFLLAVLTVGHAAYVLAFDWLTWFGLLTVWAVSGMLYSAILTPSGRLLRNSAHSQDRPAVFAAQFALSHACWLITYPVAGWAGGALGLPTTMIVLGILALAGVSVSVFVWPADDTKKLVHEHPDMSPSHPHLQEFHSKGHRHSHVFVIDDEHRTWPTHG